ncbi:MAG: 1-acyl-sn-glycerol-3-phosphate acyltransferase [Treponemataceae bacterium]|nr:1-acyl-sn-glycerol-3-phosphate acyltransferase [Treponemataceae bacterium]
MRRTYYYSDPVHDDFSPAKPEQKQLKPGYRYFPRNPIFRIAAFLLYRVVAIPVVYILNKIVYAETYVGLTKLRKSWLKGAFLYGSPPRSMGDAYTPQIISCPVRNFTLVNSASVTDPFLAFFVKQLGGIPVPDSRESYRGFMKALDEIHRRRQNVFIYPEAHIWPTYTGIRDFPAGSFDYPVKYHAPAYAVTTTFHKRRIGPWVRTRVYIDGPFWPDETLPKAEARKKLRDEVYTAMVARSKLSTYQYHTFTEK